MQEAASELPLLRTHAVPSVPSSLEGTPESSPGSTPRGGSDYHHTPRWGGISAFSEHTLKHLHKMAAPASRVRNLCTGPLQSMPRLVQDAVQLWPAPFCQTTRGTCQPQLQDQHAL